MAAEIAAVKEEKSEAPTPRPTSPPLERKRSSSRVTRPPRHKRLWPTPKKNKGRGGKAPTPTPAATKKKKKAAFTDDDNDEKDNAETTHASKLRRLEAENAELQRRLKVRQERDEVLYVCHICLTTLEEGERAPLGQSLQSVCRSQQHFACEDCLFRIRAAQLVVSIDQSGAHAFAIDSPNTWTIHDALPSLFTYRATYAPCSICKEVEEPRPAPEAAYEFQFPQDQGLASPPQFPCRGCSAKFGRRALAQHILSCPKISSPCFLNPIQCKKDWFLHQAGKRLDVAAVQKSATLHLSICDARKICHDCGRLEPAKAFFKGSDVLQSLHAKWHHNLINRVQSFRAKFRFLGRDHPHEAFYYDPSHQLRVLQWKLIGKANEWFNHPLIAEVDALEKKERQEAKDAQEAEDREDPEEEESKEEKKQGQDSTLAMIDGDLAFALALQRQLNANDDPAPLSLSSHIPPSVPLLH